MVKDYEVVLRRIKVYTEVDMVSVSRISNLVDARTTIVVNNYVKIMGNSQPTEDFMVYAIYPMVT